MNHAVLTATSEVSDVFVVVMGIVTVFIGLLCIILLCELMNRLYDRFTANKTSVPETQTPALAADIPNRREMIAAIAAAIAEENGKDLSAIRILSVKKL